MDDEILGIDIQDIDGDEIDRLYEEYLEAEWERYTDNEDEEELMIENV